MLKTTPFHARTAALSQSHAWRRWAGHVAASHYELSHEREYHAIRVAAGLLDVSPLYKYLIEGRDAVRLLDRMLPRDVTRCQPGQVLYTPWCDAAGKVLDDGTLARLAEERFRLTSADPGLLWLEENARGLDVTIRDVSASTAALALQGPRSREILQALCEDDLAGLKYFRILATRLGGCRVEISRTGYTGDLGYEIWLDAADALPLWDALMRTGAAWGLQAAGLAALDLARIEAGLMLLDVDYVSARKALTVDETSTPFELELGWAVDLKKAAFVGREALAQEAARGPAWCFTGIALDWDDYARRFREAGLAPRVPAAPWRMSVPIYSGAAQVGYATSGAWSPMLKEYIALAHLRTPQAAPGTSLDMEVTVAHRRVRAAARVVRRPFFDPERKRG